MTVLEKIKSIFRPSKPQVKAEEAKPAGAEGAAARALESKTGGGSEQKGATAA